MFCVFKEICMDHSKVLICQNYTIFCKMGKMLPIRPDADPTWYRSYLMPILPDAIRLRIRQNAADPWGSGSRTLPSSKSLLRHKGSRLWHWIVLLYTAVVKIIVPKTAHEISHRLSDSAIGQSTSGIQQEVSAGENRPMTELETWRRIIFRPSELVNVFLP
jgi:hypothetical protein